MYSVWAHYYALFHRRKASVKAKKISQPKPLEVYVAVSDYKKQEKGEVTLKAGMLVEVVEKTETGEYNYHNYLYRFYFFKKEDFIRKH
jgi:hypothetical protein